MSRMCGRYTVRRFDPAAYDAAPLFEEFAQLKIVPRFNVAPSQDVPVIRLDKDDHRVASFIRWGLIPSWTKGKPKLAPINARAETVTTSPMFKAAFNRRRCLMPADGFYEWKKLDGGNKQPYFIHLKDDSEFAFAGLWERWKPKEDAEPVDTCTHITTTPNPLMSSIHDRMPVILRKADYAKWLDRDADEATLRSMLKPLPAEEMETVPVSSRVNSPKNDSPENVEPVDLGSSNQSAGD